MTVSTPTPRTRARYRAAGAISAVVLAVGSFVAIAPADTVLEGGNRAAVVKVAPAPDGNSLGNSLSTSDGNSL